MRFLYLVTFLVLALFSSATPFWPFSAAVVQEVGQIGTAAVIKEVGHAGTAAVVKEVGHAGTAAVIEEIGDVGTGALRSSASSSSVVDRLAVRSTVEERLLPVQAPRLVAPTIARKASNQMVALIESVIEAFRSVYRSIAKEFQDINDFYRVLYPVKEAPPPPRPNTIVGNLQNMWDNRPTPIQDANDAFQKAIISRKAGKVIDKKLAWLPSSVKEKSKNWVTDKAPWMFDVLCRGKTHQNPRVQQFALKVQQKITKSNPTVNNLAIESICLFKKGGRI